MISASRPVLLALLASLVLIGGVPPATARTARAAAAPGQFVAGTYSRAGRSTLGTLWGWHMPAASDVGGLQLATLAINGPPGWNNNGPAHGCAVFNGMEPTICIGWQGIPAVSGQYTAQSSAGSWSATATSTHRIVPPRITEAKISGTSVSVAWTPVAGARSYIVAVTTANSSTCCDLQNQVVRGTAHSHTFTNVPVTQGSRYRVGVFALSAVVYRDVPLTEPFEIGEGRVTLVAGGSAKGSGPVAPGRSIKAQVHGSALVSSAAVKIVDLYIQGVPARATVIFRCLKGCSVNENLSGGGTVHTHALRGVTVPNGAVIEVRVTKTGYTGFYDRLVIHTSAVKFFTETRLCLPPNGTRPHVCKNGH